MWDGRIRPLDGHEIRERRRIGRRQISTAGRKLVDGVPFGRSFLGLRRASDRPQVGIPELGRRRLGGRTARVRFEEQEEDGDDDEDNYYQEKEGDDDEDDYYQEDGDGKIVSQVEWAYPGRGEGEDDDGEEEEEDEDYREEDVCSESDSDEKAEESEGGGDAEVPVETSRLARKAKQVPKVAKEKDQARAAGGKVQTSQALVRKIRSSVSGESNSPSSPSPSSDPNSESLESTSSSSSDSDSVSGRDFYTSSASGSESGSESESGSDSDSSSSSSSSPSSSSSRPIRKKLKVSATKSVPQQSKKPTSTTNTPGAPYARKKSAARNERLKRAKARNQLVSAGVLPPKSSNADLMKWLEEHPEGVQAYLAKTKKGYVELRKDTPRVEGVVEDAVPTRAAVVSSVLAVASPTPAALGGPQAASTTEGTAKQLNPEEAKRAKKKEKKKRAQERKRALVGTPGQQNPSIATVTPVQPSTTAALTSATVPPSDPEPKPTDPEQDHLNNRWIRKHAKNASNKKKGFLNKMAGLVPKKYTYDEQGNRIEVPTTLANFSGTLEAYEDNGEQDEQTGHLDAWRSRIVLSAVECEDEEIDVPQPMFPFVQPGWRGNGNAMQQVAGKKRKREKGKRDHGNRSSYENEQFDSAEGQAGAGAGDDWDNYNYYEDEPVVGSAMKADNTRAATQGGMEEEDLPELPVDITTLPKLTKDQVVSGAVVAFKQLTMDVNYNPIMANYRTALITEVVEETNGELALWVRLARRDRPKKRYDEAGERLFGKFEIPGDDGDDDEVMDIMFGEMIEPRVIKPADGAVKRVVAGTVAAELDTETTPVQVSEDVMERDKVMGGEEQVPCGGKTDGEVNNSSSELNQEGRELIIENATGAEAMDLDNQDDVMLPAAEVAAGPEGVDDEAEKGMERGRDMVDVRVDEGVVIEHEKEVTVEQQVLEGVGEVEVQSGQVQGERQLQGEGERDVLGGIESFLGMDRNGAQGAGAEAAMGAKESSVRSEEEKEQGEETLPVVNSDVPAIASTSYTVQSPQYTPWTDDEIENILDQGLRPRVSPAASVEADKGVEGGSQVNISKVQDAPHPKPEEPSNNAPLPEEFRIPDSSQSSRPPSVVQVQTEALLPPSPSSPLSEALSNAQLPQGLPHPESPKQRPPHTLTRQDSWDDELPELDERGYLITKSQKASSQLKPLIKEENKPKQSKKSTMAVSTAVVPLKTVAKSPAPSSSAKHRASAITSAAPTKTAAKVAPLSSLKTPVDITSTPPSTPKKRVVGRKTIVGPRLFPSLTKTNTPVEVFTPNDPIPPPSTAPARFSSASTPKPKISASSKRKSSIASASASSSIPLTSTKAAAKVSGPAGSAAKTNKVNQSAGGGAYVIDLTESGDEAEKENEGDGRLSLPPLSSQPVPRSKLMYGVPPPSSQPQQKEVKRVKKAISSESSASASASGSGSSSTTLMDDGTWRSAVKARKF